MDTRPQWIGALIKQEFLQKEAPVIILLPQVDPHPGSSSGWWSRARGPGSTEASTEPPQSSAEATTQQQETQDRLKLQRLMQPAAPSAFWIHFTVKLKPCDAWWDLSEISGSEKESTAEIRKRNHSFKNKITHSVGRLRTRAEWQNVNVSELLKQPESHGASAAADQKLSYISEYQPVSSHNITTSIQDGSLWIKHAARMSCEDMMFGQTFWSPSKMIKLCVWSSASFRLIWSLVIHSAQDNSFPHLTGPN